MLSRRKFLKSLTGLIAIEAASSFAIQPALADNGYIPTPIWIFRKGEGAYIDAGTAEGYRAAAYFLRDIRAGQVGQPHPALLQLLSWIQTWLAAQWELRPLNIHSGLRTHRTNASTEGAAAGSLHLPDRYGVFQAADIDAPGVPANHMFNLARATQSGGAGFYPGENFIHVDRGRVRYWMRKKGR